MIQFSSFFAVFFLICKCSSSFLYFYAKTSALPPLERLFPVLLQKIKGPEPIIRQLLRPKTSVWVTGGIRRLSLAPKLAFNRRKFSSTSGSGNIEEASKWKPSARTLWESVCRAQTYFFYLFTIVICDRHFYLQRSLMLNSMEVIYGAD